MVVQGKGRKPARSIGAGLKAAVAKHAAAERNAEPNIDKQTVCTPLL